MLIDSNLNFYRCMRREANRCNLAMLRFPVSGIILLLVLQKLQQRSSYLKCQWLVGAIAHRLCDIAIRCLE
jgi:hypothetical protein